MTLDELKKGWDVLNECLSQNEVINQRIIKEMILRKTNSAYDTIYQSNRRGLVITFLIGTFMLPFAMGACEAVGGNMMTDAFGIVAMIAMTPLITIQTLGLFERRRHAKMLKKLHTEISMIEDDIKSIEDAINEAVEDVKKQKVNKKEVSE